jgi:putative ABC transport system ATP-binding protein
MTSPADPAGENHFVLRTQDVWKVFPDGTEALKGVSIGVRPSEFVAIMGKSGSGKSTLLNLLGALDVPTKGEVFFDGQPLTKAAPAELDRLRSQKIGFVFQSFLLIPTLTALENVQIPMFEGKLRPRERAEKARALLTAVQLPDRLNHHSNELSGGERQRVAIARALANDPQVILADEPTGNLDTTTERMILDLLQETHRQRRVTLVIITHEPHVAETANRVIELKDGRVVYDGPPKKGMASRH